MIPSPLLVFFGNYGLANRIKMNFSLPNRQGFYKDKAPLRKVQLTVRLSLLMISI